MNFASIATGVQHIGVPTNDIRATIAFYERLGFENVHEKDNNGELVAFLKLKNLVIETYQNGKATLTAGAVDHIAIDVTDIGQAEQLAAEMDLEVIERGQLPFWTNGVKYFTVLGPNREKIEFNQMM